MIQALSLINWRNQAKFKTTFNQFNILLGPNASGKTNILESIYYASELTSWRSHDDMDLLRWQEQYFEINCQIKNEEEDRVRIFVQPNDGRTVKKIEINRINRSKKALNSLIRTVLFSPDQIELLFSPGGRRQYLNQFLSQKDYHYNQALREYTKIVRAKNIILAKLNEGFGSRPELDFWNIKLVESSQIITDLRRDWFSFASSQISQFYHLISGHSESVVIEFYLKNPPEKLLDKINENIDKEIAAGVTLYGPHRDDWGVSLKTHDLTKTGSRGEWRTMLITLKLLEAQYLTQEKFKPIILLDDFLSELDEKRKHNFFQQMTDYQLILTSAEETNLKILPHQWKAINLNG